MKDPELYNKHFLIKNEKECSMFLSVIQDRFKSIKWNSGIKPLELHLSIFPQIISISRLGRMTHDEDVHEYAVYLGIEFLEKNSYQKLLDKYYDKH